MCEKCRAVKKKALRAFFTPEEFVLRSNSVPLLDHKAYGVKIKVLTGMPMSFNVREM